MTLVFILLLINVVRDYTRADARYSDPSVDRTDASERGADPSVQQHAPMLERYLQEEDRLQKFLASPSQEDREQKEKAKDKAENGVNNQNSADQDNQGCCKLRATRVIRWIRTEAIGEAKETNGCILPTL